MNRRLLRLLCAALLVGGLLLSPLASADPPPEPVVTRSPDVDVTSAASVEFTATAAGDGIEARQGSTGTDPWNLPTYGLSPYSISVSAEGPTYLQFRSYDEQGTSPWVNANVCIDRTPPSVSMSPTGADPLPWSNTPVKVTATATDVGCASVDAIEFRTSANNGSSWDGPHPYESENDGPLITAHGTTLVEFRATDLAGNASAWQRKTVRIDTVAPSAPGARPDQIPGLLAWFDASDESSLILDGSAVSAWNDVRGGGPSATQGTAGNRPMRVLNAQNGRAAITFNGSQWLTFAGDLHPRTIIVAGRKEGVTTANSIVAKHDDAGSALLFGTSSGTGKATAAVASASAQSLGGSETAWQVLVGTTASGGTNPVTVWRNGTPGTAQTGNGAAWSIDSIADHPTSGYRLQGRIGEIAMFDRVLDNDERQLVEGYLAARWSDPIPPILPNGHPYRTPPYGVSGGSDAWLNAEQGGGWPAISGHGSHDLLSGLAGYEHRTSTDGGATWSTPSAGTSVTPTQANQGTTLVQFRAVDNAGNVSPWSPDPVTPAATRRIDTASPTLAVSGNTHHWTKDASVAVQGTSTDGVSRIKRIRYRSSVNDGPWNESPWSNAPADTDSWTTTATITAEGTSRVEFRAEDNAGNLSDWTTSDVAGQGGVRIDRTPPSGTPTLTNATGAWSGSPSVTVTASGTSDSASGVAGYRSRISTDNGVTWSAPQSGSTVTIGGENTTLVQFQAVDNAGNAGAWSASVAGGSGSVRLDRTRPTPPTVAANVSGWSNAPSATVTASGGSDGGSGVAGYQWATSTDGGDRWSAATNGGTAIVSGQGVTLVRMRTVDAVGNTSLWAPAVAVMLDHELPTAAIHGATGEWTNAASVTATATASDGLSGVALIQHRLSTDGGASWSSPATASSVAVGSVGTTLVQFRAFDNAGNIGAWTTAAPDGQGAIRIDRTPPTATIHGATGQWSNAASVDVTATGQDDASGVGSFEHRLSLDGGTTWTAPAAGGAVAVSAQGETLISFRAIDRAGNVGDWTAATSGGSGAVRIDRAPPGAPRLIVSPDTTVPLNSSRGAVLIHSAPPETGKPAVRIVITENGRLVHNGDFGTVRDTGLMDNTTYIYRAVAYDRLGNASPMNDVRITTPSRTPPDQPTAPDATGWPAKLTWKRAAGATGYRIVRDGTTVATVDEPRFDDPGALDIAAPFAVGSVASEATDDGVLLRWMPTADRGSTYRYQVIALDQEGNSTPSAEFVHEVISGGVTYEIAVDGAPVIGATNAAPEATAAGLPADLRSARVPLEPGQHEVTVTAIDAAGNRAVAARLTAYGPDLGPNRLTARASSPFAKPGERITLTATAPKGAVIRWSFPDGRTLTGAQVTRRFRAGTVAVTVTARLPNGETLRSGLNVIVDGAAPVIGTRMTGRRLRVSVRDAGGVASVTGRIGHGKPRPIRIGFLPIPEGRHRVTIVATDVVGNRTTKVVTAIVDTRGPTITVRASARPGRKLGTIVWSVTDRASGVASVSVNTTTRSRARGRITVPAGQVAVIIARDRVGNTTRVAAPVPAPMRLMNLRDPGLQGRRGDRLLPGGGRLTGIRAVVLSEARSRLDWAGVLGAKKGAADRYTPLVRRAVMRFQTLRRVREPAGKGVLGPATLRAMDKLARWGGWGAKAGRG